MTSTKEALEPCPFCKGDDITVADNVEVWGQSSDQVYARCGKCGANGPSAYTDQTALTKWNTRATFQPDGEKREAIARMIDDLLQADYDLEFADHSHRETAYKALKSARYALDTAIDNALASGLVQDEAGIRGGYVLMPSEPTQAMVIAGEEVCCASARDNCATIYRAMISSIRSARDGGE